MSPISFQPSPAFKASAQNLSMSAANKEASVGSLTPSAGGGVSATLKNGVTSLLKGLGDSLLNAARMTRSGLASVSTTFSSAQPTGVKPQENAGDRHAMVAGGVAGVAVLAVASQVGEVASTVVEMSHAEVIKGGIEILSLKSEVIAKAMETAMPTLETGLSALGVGLGVYNLASGLNSAASAAMCVSRSEGLKSAATVLTAIPTTSSHEASQVKQMIDDLSFCQKENACRATDKAISGALDVAAGTASLVSAGLTAGLAAPIVAVAGWAIGSMVKTGLAIYRGTQTSETKDIQREHISKRLEDGLKQLQFKAANDVPLAASDKAMLVALKSVGLVDKHIDIHADLSPKTTAVLHGLTSEHLENSFTKETETLRKEDSKIAAGVLNGIAAVKSFFGTASSAATSGVSG